MDRPVTSEEIKLVIKKTIPTKKSPAPDGLASLLNSIKHLTFKRELLPILPKP